jgi:alkylation response protein AidB-like acyl-CoA dehydrogenase
MSRAETPGRQGGPSTLYPIYSVEHREFAGTVDRFVQKVVGPLAEEVDFDSSLSTEAVDHVWRRFRGHGVVEELPRRADGPIDWVALAILLEGLARADASLAVMFLSNYGFRELVADALSSEQKETFRHLFQPDVNWAGAFSEPEAGSHVAGMTTTARRRGPDWILDGTKTWVTGGHHARALMVACRVVDETGEARGRGIFLLDRSESRFDTRQIEMLGLRASGHAEIVLDGAVVPGHARLDREGSGSQSIARLLRTLSVNPAIVAVGLGQRSLDVALDHAVMRTQFGRPIAGFQLVQELLATMATEVSMGRLLTHRAIADLESGASQSEINSSGSMAKWFCTEMAVRAASSCVQICGALGLATESVGQRLLRDARMYTIAGGTSQIQSLIIGRELTGISAFR